MGENYVLKCEFEKENMFLEELSNRCNNTQGRKVLNEFNTLNNTQKMKQNEKKKKLTITSQSSTKN